MTNAQIYVDASDVIKLANNMAKQLTNEQFDKLMRRTLNETGKHTRSQTSKEIRKEYVAPAAWVKKGILAPKISGGGGNLQCKIPLKGEKAHIGGTVPATGGFYGWNPPKYRISAQIVKGQTSVLPASMAQYGGQPPFRNLGGKGLIGKNTKNKKNLKLARKLGTTVYTRSGPAFRAKFKSVSALAVPQMPMNRARPAIENDILEYAEKRVIHNFSRIFG